MDYFAYAIVAGLAVAGGTAGYFAARCRAKAVLVSMWAIVLTFSVAMAGLMHATPGWDAVIYAVILFGVCAPAGLGLLFGSSIGFFNRKPIAGG